MRPQCSFYISEYAKDNPQKNIIKIIEIEGVKYMFYNHKKICKWVYDKYVKDYDKT